MFFPAIASPRLYPSRWFWHMASSLCSFRTSLSQLAHPRRHPSGRQRRQKPPASTFRSSSVPQRFCQTLFFVLAPPPVPCCAGLLLGRCIGLCSALSVPGSLLSRAVQQGKHFSVAQGYFQLLSEKVGTKAEFGNFGRR